MVYGKIVEGSPDEIREKIAKIVGDRRVSVLLMEDAVATGETPNHLTDQEFEKAMEELRAMAVSAPHADDSREAIYTRQPGE